MNAIVIFLAEITREPGMTSTYTVTISKCPLELAKWRHLSAWQTCFGSVPEQLFDARGAVFMQVSLQKRPR